MSQSVVNTNISSVTDPNGSRGESPSSVMAFDMGAATGTAAAQAFDATKLVAGAETVGAYQGTLADGTASANGALQLITLTFAVDFEWTAATHYCDVSFVSIAGAAGNQTILLSAGTGNASFSPGSDKIVIKRCAGTLAAGGAKNLTAAHMVVRVRKRGVEQA
jgi:hypothetical protein